MVATAADLLLDAVFQAAESGLCLLGADGVVLRANEPWLSSMELTREEALGRSLSAIAPTLAAVVFASRPAPGTGPIPLPPRLRGAGREWSDELAVVPVGDGTGLLISTREARRERPIRRLALEGETGRAPTSECSSCATTNELVALRNAVEELPIGVVVVESSPEGPVPLTQNAAHRRMLGTRLEERSPRGPRYQLFRADRTTPLEIPEWPGARAIESGSIVKQAVIHARLPDGEWRVFESSAAPVTTASGECLRAVVATIDETERHRATEALRHSETVYRSAFANISDAVALLEAVRDASGTVLDWCVLDANDALARILGTSVGALAGRSMSETVRERLERLGVGLRAVLSTGSPWRYEIRSGGSDYIVKVFRIDASRLGIVATDITSLKGTEASLRKREEQLRVLVEHTPAGIALLDRDLQYLAVSRQFARDFRLDTEALLGRRHYDVFPDIPERWREIHRRCLAGAVERCAEDPFPRADGSIDWVKWEIQPWRDPCGEIGGLVLFSQLVTEQKEAADKLIAAKERLAVTLASIGDAVIATDVGSRVTLLNGVAEQLTGWCAADALGRPLDEIFQVVSEDSGERLRSPAARALTEGVVVGLANHAALVARDGSKRPIADSAAPIRDAQGIVSGAVLVFRDQTEERRSQAALARSRSELFSLIEKLPLGVFVTDSHEILYANPTFASYFGRTPGELLGRRPEHLSASAASTPPEPGKEWAVLGPGGKLVTLECSSSREIVFEGRPALLWTCRDLSELKAMQARLLDSDRLATLGMLAAGVAHEINNPLTYVIAALDLTEESLAEKVDDLPRLELSDALESLRDARQGAMRVKAIVGDLKAFSRAEQDHPERLSLPRLLDSAIGIASNAIKHRASLVRDYGAAPVVEGNEARLGQVFVNLLVNAAQAIPDGQTERNEIRVALRADARGNAVVEVSDTGVGIPPEIIDRIFDPFFTTKAGTGTGLGLAISRNTITAMGGDITVESRPGSGTTVRVVLPAGAAVSVRSAMPHKPEPPKSRKARVLVVDDESAICKVFRRTLQNEHDVVTEESAAAAWARLERGERFDVIFCDVMMPEMSGMDLYSKVKAGAPDQAARVVFITGGTYTERAATFLEEVPNPRMEKPFDPRAIRAMVGQVAAMALT